MSVAYNKFNAFTAAIANKVHNLASDQLTIALTNVIPTAANAVLSDITQISYTNLSSRNLSTTSSTQTSGTYKLVVADLTLTASGAVPTFQYIVIYNSTTGSGNLICWYDYGIPVTLGNPDQFVVDLDQVNGVLQIV
jgi:hypothetical protein